MNENYYARPVIPLLIALMAGIAAGNRIPGYAVWISCTGILSAAIVIRKNFQHKKASFSPVILFICLGYLSILPFASPHIPPDHVGNFTDSEKYKIVGRIDTVPIEKSRRIKFYLNTESLFINGENRKVSGKIRVTVYGECFKLSKGDSISFKSRIRSFRNFKNPGGFDYKQYMIFRDVWGSAYTRGDRLSVLERKPSNGISGLIEASRTNISELIARTGQGDHTAVLKALITGDRSGISPSLRDAFNRAGAGHILAISGLHIGIVASVAFFLFSRLLSLYKPFLFQAWTKKGAAVLSLFPVLMYGLIAGMSPSTQRAVIMVGVFLMTFLVERDHDLINTLAVAAIVILIVHPPSLYSISFQLSFSAVLAIVYGLSVIRINNAVNHGRLRQAGYRIISFLMVSLFAILGTLPLVMLYFNQISLIGLSANLVLVPLIGFLAVPAGLASVFIFPLSMQCAMWGIQASAWILKFSLKVIYFISGLPFAAVKTVTPTPFEICCYYMLLWAVLNIKRKPVARIVAVVVFVLCIGDAVFWMHHRYWHKDLRVTVIDVGQGTACLMELPGGYTVLADGGGFSDNTLFDMGERIIAPLLWRKKIKTVDTLVLSHPNSDHLNGLLYIAGHFNVKNVWTNGEPADTAGYKRFMEIIRDETINMPEFSRLERSREINGVTLEILYPRQGYLKKGETRKKNDSNNNSLVLKAGFGITSFLFPGDIMASGERKLIKLSEHKLKSTVLVSPHHGSKTSSTKKFLDAVNPEVVVIPAGWKNRFGFPHPSVIKKYNERGYRIFRTDKHGAVEMTTDGESLLINTTTL